MIVFKIRHLLHEIKTSKSMDEIDQKISTLIHTLYDNRKSLAIDFIIESLDKIGRPISIINNDDGKFAFGDFTAIQNVNLDTTAFDLSISFFIEKKYFKDTVSEAMEYYLEHLETS